MSDERKVSITMYNSNWYQIASYLERAREHFFVPDWITEFLKEEASK